MTAKSAGVIAVVEDDPHVLEALGNLLKSAGYTVVAFNSAEALLANCTIGDFDCLISDIGLPGMNGIDLQTEIGRKAPDLPVILITGRDDHLPQRAAIFNNRGLFRKPVDAEQLLDSLNAATTATRR
jgi:FixJ family two-component response regulator